MLSGSEQPTNPDFGPRALAWVNQRLAVFIDYRQDDSGGLAPW